MNAKPARSWMAIPFLAAIILVLAGLILYTQEVHKLELQIAELNNKLLQAEVDLWKEKTRRQEEMFRHQETELANEREKTATLEKGLAEAKADADSAKKALAQAESLAKVLEGQVAQLQGELNDETQKRTNASGQVATLSKRLSDTKSELDRVRQEVDQARSQPDSTPQSAQLSKFLSKVRTPPNTSGYLDEHICASQGKPPGCTKKP